MRMNQQRRVDVGRICFAVILLFEFVMLKVTKSEVTLCTIVRC